MNYADYLGFQLAHYYIQNYRILKIDLPELLKLAILNLTPLGPDPITLLLIINNNDIITTFRSHSNEVIYIVR